jgi:branched-chain amino acid transport system permease protein
MNSSNLWVNALQKGLIGGGAAVLLALVGMIGRFSERPVIEGVATLGYLLLMVIFFVAGYQGARANSGVLRVVSGLLAGLTAALVVALLVVFGQAVNLRAMFINASPELFEVLTLGNFALLPLVGALIGVVAALFGFLPARLRNALALGLSVTAVLGMLSDQLLLILNNNGIAAWFQGWLLAPKGVTLTGALITTAAVAAINFWRTQQQARQTAQRQLRPTNAWVRRSGWLVLLLVLIYLPQFLGAYHSNVLNQVGLFVLLGLGLNIVVGFAGMLDVGYVAFYALGAYAMGMLTSSEGFVAQATGQWNFWEAVPVALVVATIAGIILGIPVLKIRGDYLTIVTLGFGEIIRLLALSEWLRPYTGGAQGIAAIPPIEIAGLFSISGPEKPQRLFYVVLICCLLAIFVAMRLKNSRLGRAWMAVREDEDVAEAMGINLVQTKLLAFATGAAFSGVSGAIAATNLGTIYPHSFGLLISINILALIIVGGMGSIPGVILGSLVLVGLPELLREFSEFRLLVYGAVLIFMMLQRPEGLLPDQPQELIQESA